KKMLRLVCQLGVHAPGLFSHPLFAHNALRLDHTDLMRWPWVFGQMKDRKGAGRFSMRGTDRCRGEWQLDAAVHNLRKLHRDSVQRAKAGGRGAQTSRKAAAGGT